MFFAKEHHLLYPVVKNVLASVYQDGKINEKMADVFLAVMANGDKGITTRGVAERCDLTVYAARNWLIRLEEKNLVVRKIDPRNTIWFWTDND